MENNEILNAATAEAITAENSIMGAVNREMSDSETSSVQNLSNAIATNAITGGLTEEQLKQMQIQYRKTQPLVRNYNKIGRNDKCPCGSGKKYKDCCMGSKTYEGYTERGTKANPYDKNEEAA